MIFAGPRSGSMMLRGLDVAMHDAALVRVGQALGHLAGDLDRLDRRDRALLHALAQVGALEQLHREVGHAVDLAEIVGGDDVRVVELARRLRLEQEALLVVGAPLGVLVQADGLQRDDAVEVRDPRPCRPRPSRRGRARRGSCSGRSSSPASPSVAHPLHQLAPVRARSARAPPPRTAAGSASPSARAMPVPIRRDSQHAARSRYSAGCGGRARARSGVNSSCARSPGSLNVPAGASAASRPGAASAIASRKEREASMREAPARTPPRMRRPRCRRRSCLRRSCGPASCSAPWFRPAESGRPTATAVSARSARRSARARIVEHHDRRAVGGIEHHAPGGGISAAVTATTAWSCARRRACSVAGRRAKSWIFRNTTLA